MFDNLRRQRTRVTFVRLFPIIVLLSIGFPLVLYMNVKSINLYFTAIRLRNTLDEVIDDTTSYIRNLKTTSGQTNLHDDRMNVRKGGVTANIFTKYPQITTTTINSNSTKSIAKDTWKLETTSSRPLTCDECFFLKFQFLIENKNICKSENGSVDILILITSAPKHFLARTTIRETWLTYSNKNTERIRYAFLIGQSTEDLEVRKENDFTQDIILANFKDAYSNLTLKTLMGFYWTLQYCNNAKFVMKTDDDIYINIPGLIKKVNQNDRALQTAVGGSCNHIALPIRNKKSKWYASYQSYPQKTYPGFCSGTGYITSFNVVSKIVGISKNIPFFHLEDVYVSLCVKKLGYRLHLIKGFIEQKKMNPCVFKNDNFVTAHQVSIKSMRYIWDTPCTKSKTI